MTTSALGLPLDANQREITLRLENQRLRQDLQAARALNQEHEAMILSLFSTLKSFQNNVCVNCKGKLVPSDSVATPADVILSPLPRLPSHPHPEGSSRVPFWRRIFKGPGRSLSPSTTSGSSSPRTHHALLKSSQETFSLSVQSPDQIIPAHLPSSASVPQAALSDAKEHFQPAWSVTINDNVNPSMKISLERSMALENSVGCVRFSTGGEYLAAGVNDENGAWRVYIYDVKTGIKKFTLGVLIATTRPYLWYMCFSQNGQYLAIADSDKRIWVWKIRKKHVRNAFKGHTELITSVDFSPDGRFVASSSYDNTVRIWSSRDGSSKVLKHGADTFHQVRFSPNGKHIAAAHHDGMLKIWNARTGQLVKKWTAHETFALSLVFTPDGNGLISGGWDRKVKYWNISQAELGTSEVQIEEIPRLTGPYTDAVEWLDVSSNGQWLVTGSAEGGIEIWDVRSFTLQCTLQANRRQTLSAAFSPTGEYMASGSEDGQLALWRYVGT